MTTSRVGRKPVTVPAGVVVAMQGDHLHIKGPMGEKSVPIHPAVLVQIQDGHITFKQNPEVGYTRSGSGLKLNKSIVGTTRANVSNFVNGTSKVFERKLVLVGVGYRSQVKGKELNLTLGFSHPVNIEIPEGITIETPTQTEILVKGINKHLVGHVASKIRALRSPEPYKGKGIRYANEVIVLKETKKK